MDIVIKVYFTSLDIKSKAWKRNFLRKTGGREKGKKNQSKSAKKSTPSMP
jgi:hypothetical protein